MTVNGKQLIMTKGETELEMVPYVEGGEMVFLWQLHREGLGNAVEITTGQSMLLQQCLTQRRMTVHGWVVVLSWQLLEKTSVVMPVPGRPSWQQHCIRSQHVLQQLVGHRTTVLCPLCLYHLYS